MDVKVVSLHRCQRVRRLTFPYIPPVDDRLRALHGRGQTLLKLTFVFGINLIWALKLLWISSHGGRYLPFHTHGRDLKAR